MWLFIGTGETLQPVIGGMQIERPCEKCEQTTMFYEKRASKTVELYFMNVFAFAPRHVMSCGACGASFATGEAIDTTFAETQKGTLLGKVGELATSARDAIDDERIEAGLKTAQAKVGETIGDAKAAVDGWLKKRRGT